MDVKNINLNSHCFKMVKENATEETLCQKVKFALTPNRKLVPLKMTIFFFGCSAFSILPYLTIHMKDIGISVENIAIIYAILPFTSLVSSPLVGFLADRLGSYTKVLMLTLFGDALFFSLLLAVPVLEYVEVGSDGVDTSPIELIFDEGSRVRWKGLELPCVDWNGGCGRNYTQFPSLALSNCVLSSCSYSTDLCSAFQDSEYYCTSLTNQSFILTNLTYIPHCVGNLSKGVFYDGVLNEVIMDTECELTCTAVDFASECEKNIELKGNEVLTNIVYFILRALANMCLGCSFILIDAQTIQMCKVQDEANQKRVRAMDGSSSKPQGSLGRQFVMSALAQAIISPIVGKLMDLVSQTTGKPNYLVPFMGNVLFLILTIVMVCFIKLDVSLPKSEGFKGLKKLFVNIDIDVFLFMTFILGNCWGFVETFLFVYLKDDMGAPMSLLGLTITTGAVASIPFLYIADWIVEKMGRVNVFITALAMYAVRYIGYSFITNPWMAFPFEALELFTNNLMRVAAVQYVGAMAPKGLLATLNGLVGGLHYGFGKGTGSLLGGAIIAASGSTAFAFRCFGIGAAIFSVIYFAYEYCVARLCVKRIALAEEDDIREKTKKESLDEELKDFLAN